MHICAAHLPRTDGTFYLSGAVIIRGRRVKTVNTSEIITCCDYVDHFILHSGF